MFSFLEKFGSSKYHIVVDNYTEKKISYIKEIDEKTYSYTAISDPKAAKLFKVEKASAICDVLRKKNKGIGYRIGL